MGGTVVWSGWPYVSSCHVICNRPLSDAGVRSLGQAMSMLMPFRIDLSSSGITDGDLEVLLQGARAWDLRLRQTKVTGDAFDRIEATRAMRRLDVAGCPISGDGLLQLLKCARLESVAIDVGSISANVQLWNKLGKDRFRYLRLCASDTTVWPMNGVYIEVGAPDLDLEGLGFSLKTLRYIKSESVGQIRFIGTALQQHDAKEIANKLHVSSAAVIIE